MRGLFIKGMLCLLAAVFLVGMRADAAQRTATRKSRGDGENRERAYSLEDVMKAPREYLEREVVFYSRYAANANLFKPASTRFNVNHHLNFAVWPDKAVLWEEKARKNILPTLYIAKNDPATLEILHGVRRYELLAVTGMVQNVYAGYPWILVTKLERVEKPSERLTDMVIEHMQSGYDALRAESGGVAARHFEQALVFGLPGEYRSRTYEQLAQAYLLDNKLDRARGYLRQAVQVDRADAILHLALADVALRMEDPGEALAHATFALERSGRYPQAYGIRGEAMSLLGDYGKAFDDLNTAAGTPGITAREKAMVNIRRARIYARSDRSPDAARVYAAASEPGEPLSGESWLHNEIGLFYERLYLEGADAKYLESAYAAFDEGARIGSLDPDILYNMTEVEFRRQRLADAPDFTRVAELVERIYQIEPDYTPARILEGRMLFSQGKYEEAEARYQSVSTQIGNDPMALLALAEAYIDLGRDADAADVAGRARELQPWNRRVQALGKLIEENAAEIAARAAAEKAKVRPASMESVIVPGEPLPDSTQEAVETELPAAGAELPKAGKYSGLSQTDEAEQTEGAERTDRPSTLVPGDPEWEYAADVTAQDEEYPQEIQTSVNPALEPSGRVPYPATEVRLPGALFPGQTRLDLGFTPGRPDKLEAAAEHDADDLADDFNEDFGDGYRWEGSATGGESAPSPRYGMIEIDGAANAYASIPLPDFELPGPSEAEGARIPRAFSFEPDDSPIILASVSSPGGAGRPAPARNASLYRPFHGGRKMAEIIEREPVNPRPGLNGTPAMVPPAGGAVRRAEVRLPSSSRGVGALDGQPEYRE